MILFFEGSTRNIIAVGTKEIIQEKDIEKLIWLFDNAALISKDKLEGTFLGPRKEMITPWSTNAVEITQNMGIVNIKRIEEFHVSGSGNPHYDPMLQTVYKGLDQNTFTVDKQPDPVIYVDDIREYNKREGLALNEDEVIYLEGLSRSIGRKLTDSEVFGFSQVNSEHCRHKIFNGTFIISGEEKEATLFQIRIQRQLCFHAGTGS
jgi:phosphoribosylformylglycinamidine synthase